SRGIQSDGPAATFTLFAVAAFMEAGCRGGVCRMIWIGAGGAALAVLVRPPAVVVLVTPAAMALQRFVAAHLGFTRDGPLKNSSRASPTGGAPKARWQEAARIAMPVLWIAVMPAVAALAAWSSYNWFQFKYPGPSNFGSTVRFVGGMDTGTFDVRSLRHNEQLRQIYLTGREAT